MPDRVPTVEDLREAVNLAGEIENEAPKVNRAPSAPPRRGEIKAIEEGLTRLFAMGAIVFQMRGDAWCGQYMVENAVLPARAWAKLAEQNETIKNALLAIVVGGAYSEAVFSTVIFIVPMLAHHGRVPEEIAAMLGVKDIPKWEGRPVPTSPKAANDGPTERV